MKELSYNFYENGDIIYKVEQGDTLDKIANKFSTTKELVIKDNFLETEVSKFDVLYIKTYKKVVTVKVGDTPESVAKALGVSVEEMFRINKINYVYPFMQVVSND